MNDVGLAATFAGTLFVSAFLCFAIEPMFGKMVLVPLGGAPAVWNTCVIFFQAALLAGYAYAHVITTRLSIRRQTVVHGVFLAIAAVTLPPALPQGWVPPVDRNPVPWLLATLVMSLGAPFFLVSASAPLLQRWFSTTPHRSARDPYFLYAVSNAGSLLALFAYPLLIEPHWSLAAQRLAWSGGFLVLAALMLTCAVMTWRSGARRAVPEDAGPGIAASPVSSRRKLMWLACAMVPSSLMLAVTTYISTDIAAIPLLWIAPLTAYLVSFVVAFGNNGVRIIRAADALMPWSALALAFALLMRMREPLWLLLPLHLFSLFVCATVLHGRLAADRPAVAYLTGFFLWTGAGGLIGGVLSTLVAPAVLTRVDEYPIALVLACLLRPRPAVERPRQAILADLGPPLGFGLAALVILLARDMAVLPVAAAGGFLAAMLVFAHMVSRQTLRFALTIALMLSAGEFATAAARDGVFVSRTFFGVYRINERDGFRTLVHGTTVHGRQQIGASGEPEPLTYYHRSGPIGQALQLLSSRLENASVAVVGLGTGSLAAYARERQHWTFYEIDPAVEQIARDRSWFSFLTECGARCAVVLGDARLSLGRFDGRYDLIVFDAFSSDAIPIHLLTREALDLYLSRIQADGVLAFHISNRHLDLVPVLAALAAERRLVIRVQRHTPSASEIGSGALPSDWVVVARSETAMGSIAADPRWHLPDTALTVAPWTDDFSQIIAVVKFR
jgi:SAM-dependent methyltransferase